MQLSIITVTWNSEEFIAPLILSVQKACSNISFEHVIVDNASSDKTVEIIKQQFPHIQLIKNATNIGFAAANNMAASRAKGKYFLFLNPDIQIKNGNFADLIQWMDEHEGAAIAGIKLVNKNHELDSARLPRRFPTVFDQLIVVLKLHHIFPSLLDRYLYKDKDFNQIQEVDSVPGSGLMMRRSLYEACGYAFDPRYYIWFEDVDMCKEAFRRGKKVIYLTYVEAIDYVGKSFKKSSWIWRQKKFIKSMYTYFKKWGFK